MKYQEWKIPYIAYEDMPAGPTGTLSALLAAVLRARGLTDPEAAEQFIACPASLLTDPFALRGMKEAAERIRQAIAAGEHVAVYGDYDVDGITSSCLLTDYLRSCGLRCEIYIPDRQCEGYGVNRTAVETLAKKGVTLIITVDCGVTAVDEAAYAAAMNIDFIVTDHHECQSVLPDAVAVVDPKQDPEGPGQQLAGVGVAFKLICALTGESEAILDRYADLVAFGTVADVMPIVGENRYIIRRGLAKLSAAPRAGLRALIEESGLAGKAVTSTSIGYTLAPRLNAAGRLGETACAQALIFAETAEDAHTQAEALCELNRRRQAIEQQIWNEANAMLAGTEPTHPIVLFGETWHQGVIGIAASRLSETYHVPAVMICPDGDRCKGSCRSVAGFNLFEALSACSAELDGFGGHAQAAGLTLQRDKIDSFRAALAAYYDAHPPESRSVLDIELRIDRPELLSEPCVADLERLEPCGNGNPSAQFCLTGAVLEDLTPIGGGKHLRLHLAKFGSSYEAVFFSVSAAGLGLHSGERVDAAFLAQINEYRGRRSVQLTVTDIRPHDGADAAWLLHAPLKQCPSLISMAPGKPRRSDFARLWRSVSRAGGSAEGVPDALLEQLAPEMPDTLAALCLRIFEEIGLLRLSEWSGRFRVTQISGARGDLESSTILNAFPREVS